MTPPSAQHSGVNSLEGGFPPLETLLRRKASGEKVAS